MEPSVTVIGTVFMDVKGFAFNNYNPLGRNLGSVEFIHGGVGRNIAENLAALELSVAFVSTVDQTAIGTEVIERLNNSRINTAYLRQAEKDGMGMWLALLSEKGELVGSISKMPDLSTLSDLLGAEGKDIISNSSHIALELDLSSKITRDIISLSKAMEKPVYGIPGNFDVIMKNQDILPELECFICNDIEAGRLMGMDLTDLSIEELTGLFSKQLFTTAKCPRYMVVTLGSRGCIYYDSAINITTHQPAIQTEVLDTSGAGDAFFSGTVMGLINNEPLSQAVVYGNRIASYTLRSKENTYRGSAADIRTLD